MQDKNVIDIECSMLLSLAFNLYVLLSNPQPILMIIISLQNSSEACPH